MRIILLLIFFSYFLIIGKTQPVPPGGCSCTSAKELKSDNITVNSAELSWICCSDYLYKVYLYKADTFNIIQQKLINKLIYIISDLDSNTTYWFRIVSFIDSASYNSGTVLGRSKLESFKTKTTINSIDEKVIPSSKFDFTVCSLPQARRVKLIINKDNAPANLEIYNLTGIKVFHETIKGYGKILREYDIGNLPQGIYLVKLVNSSFVMSHKIIL